MSDDGGATGDLSWPVEEAGPAELRRLFAAELQAAGQGRPPDPATALDDGTKAALARVARAHPDAPWQLVDHAHEAFSAEQRRWERGRRPRPRDRGPIVWTGDERRAAAYRDGAFIGLVERHEVALPRFGWEGDVRWEPAGSSYEASAFGEPLDGRFGSMAAARAAVEDRLR